MGLMWNGHSLWQVFSFHTCIHNWSLKYYSSNITNRPSVIVDDKSPVTKKRKLHRRAFKEIKYVLSFPNSNSLSSGGKRQFLGNVFACCYNFSVSFLATKYYYVGWYPVEDLGYGFWLRFKEPKPCKSARLWRLK